MRVSKQWCTLKVRVELPLLHKQLNKQAEQKLQDQGEPGGSHFLWLQRRTRSWQPLQLQTTWPQFPPPCWFPKEECHQNHRREDQLRGARCLTLEECVHFITKINGLLFNWSLCCKHQALASGRVLGMPPASLLPAGQDGASLRRSRVCSAEGGFIIGDWPLLLAR